MEKECNSKKVEILLIEDNPGDVRLTKEALKEGKILNNLHIIENGVDGVHFYTLNRSKQIHEICESIGLTNSDQIS